MAGNDREIIILPRFKSSLIEIWDYISQDSVKQADIFITDLAKVMDKIEEYPDSNPMFRPLAGKRKLYRYRIYKKNYLIIYKLLKVKLIYIRIISSKRNPKIYGALKTTDY